MKKLTTLLFIFLAPVLIYIGCCKCGNTDTSNLFKDITGITTSSFGQGGSFSVDTAYVRDSLVTRMNFKYNYVAKNHFNNSNLMNEASAFSCRCNYSSSKGLKYKIDSLVIVSDKVFNGKVPNTNLAEFITARFSDGNALRYGTVAQSVDSSFNPALKAGTFEYNQVEYFLGKPTDNKTHRITFKLYYNNMEFSTTEGRLVHWL